MHVAPFCGRWQAGCRRAESTVVSCVLQSLHTTVLPLGSMLLFPLEVQILTSKMQELAEFGIAGTARATQPQTLTSSLLCSKAPHRTARPPQPPGCCAAGEKWVATDAQSYSFGSQDSDSDSELDVPLSKPWRPGMVADLLRMLPRLVGLNHNLVNGAATLAINGSVLPIDNLPARRRLRINGDALSGLESSLAGRSTLVANGRSHPKVPLQLSIDKNGVETCSEPRRPQHALLSEVAVAVAMQTGDCNCDGGLERPA